MEKQVEPKLPKLTVKYRDLLRDLIRKHGENATLGDIRKAEGWIQS